MVKRSAVVLAVMFSMTVGAYAADFDKGSGADSAVGALIGIAGAVVDAAHHQYGHPGHGHHPGSGHGDYHVPPPQPGHHGHHQPGYPPPQPGYPPPQPGHGQAVSLQGYCQDYDHSQFRAAKDFAYNSDGLNYTDGMSTEWALNYNRTHACGTIQEYRSRYRELYLYAYDSSFLNMTSGAAREYALQRVETVAAWQVRDWKTIFRAVYSFLYDSQYLNNTSGVAINSARTWNERGYCGDTYMVENMKREYVRQYDFAYSSSGLNYTSGRAKAYALESVRRMTPCGDLLN